MDLGNFKFTDKHEWVSVENGVATIGISDFAQKELGDIVYVDLPSVGDNVAKDDACVNIESVKAVSDLYSPITGEVVEINEGLDDSPEKINESPYEEGWIIKIKFENEDELKGLMGYEEYSKYLEGKE